MATQCKGTKRGLNTVTVPLLFSIILLTALMRVERLEAARTLQGDPWRQHSVLLMEKLPRGRVPASKTSPCTHIPGRGKGRCTTKRLMEIDNVAANVDDGYGGRGTGSIAAAGFPSHMIKVGVAAAAVN